MNKEKNLDWMSASPEDVDLVDETSVFESNEIKDSAKEQTEKPDEKIFELEKLEVMLEESKRELDKLSKFKGNKKDSEKETSRNNIYDIKKRISELQRESVKQPEMEDRELIQEKLLQKLETTGKKAKTIATKTKQSSGFKSMSRMSDKDLVDETIEGGDKTAEEKVRDLEQLLDISKIENVDNMEDLKRIVSEQDYKIQDSFSEEEFLMVSVVLNKLMHYSNYEDIKLVKQNIDEVTLPKIKDYLNVLVNKYEALGKEIKETEDIVIGEEKKYTENDFIKAQNEAEAVKNEIEKIEGKWSRLEDFLKRDIESSREDYNKFPIENKEFVVTLIRKSMENYTIDEERMKSFLENVSGIKFTEKNKERLFDLASKLYGDLLKELEFEQEKPEIEPETKVPENEPAIQPEKSEEEKRREAEKLKYKEIAGKSRDKMWDQVTETNKEIADNPEMADEDMEKTEDKRSKRTVRAVMADVGRGSYEETPKERGEWYKSAGEALDAALKEMQIKHEREKIKLTEARTKAVENFGIVSDEEIKRVVSKKNNQQAGETEKGWRGAYDYILKKLPKNKIEENEGDDEIKFKEIVALEFLKVMGKGGLEEALKDEGLKGGGYVRMEDKDIETIAKKIFDQNGGDLKELKKKIRELKFWREDFEGLVGESGREIDLDEGAVDVIGDPLPKETVEPTRTTEETPETPEMETAEIEEVNEEMKRKIRGALKKMKMLDKKTFNGMRDLIDNFSKSEKPSGNVLTKEWFYNNMKNMDLIYDEIKDYKTKDFMKALEEVYEEVKGEEKNADEKIDKKKQGLIRSLIVSIDEDAAKEILAKINMKTKASPKMLDLTLKQFEESYPQYTGYLKEKTKKLKSILNEEELEIFEDVRLKEVKKIMEDKFK